MRLTILPVGFLALLLLYSATDKASAAEKTHDWHAGRVLDSQRNRYFVGTESTSNTNGTVYRPSGTLVGSASPGAYPGNAGGTYQGTTNTEETAVYKVYETFLIEGDDYAYLAQERLRWRWSKPANLIVNGPVKYAVEKRNLFVIDEDGKEHEMEIVKQTLRLPPEGPKQAPAKASDTQFATQLAAEFPELVEDNNRVSAGQAPQTELYKRTAKIYSAAVKNDPSLGNSGTAILMAARQAKAEMAQEVAASAQAQLAPIATAPHGSVLVRFVSTPPGAEIDIDGIYWGTTPTGAISRLNAGTHTVTIKKLGHKSWERKIDLAPGDDRTINAELEIDPAKPHIVGLD